MFTNKNLKFPHKAILTSELLQEIHKYPREFFRLLYKNYCDGIICGLNYFIDEEKNLILSAGIVLLDGAFYFLEDNLNISELAEKNNLVGGNDYFISLQKESQKKSPCMTENKFIVNFSEEEQNFTLGKFRFKSKDDFNLPILSDDEDNPFENLFRDSRLNLVEVQFSDKEFATFHPLIFEVVKNFLLSKKNKTPFDYSILTCLQNNEVISLQTVKSYIAEETGEDTFENRRELLETFCQCLVSSEFKSQYSDSEEVTESPRRPPRHIPCQI
ncbi:MAG: hypothetical protein IK062_03115 [Selenomonadaceae bacterium]|nr:hypothetical protein [Selenomonadaceae bacterium]